MRKLIILSTSAAALFAAGLFAAPGAQAMPAGPVGGLAIAVHQTSPLQQAAVHCRRAWRCDWRGCGWRRTCWRDGRHWGSRHRHHHNWWAWRGHRHWR